MKYRFIILIDFSSYSKHLIQFAYEWSKKINAEILLLHKTIVMSPSMAFHESKIHLANIANRNALEQLKEYAEDILPKGTSVKFLVSEKMLVNQLRRLLQEPYDNLVFLGLKGTGLLKKIFMGSEAIKVIDGIDSLIVAIPRNAKYFSAGSIHVAVQKNYPLNVVDFNKFLNFTGDQIKKIAFFSVITSGVDLGSTEKYLKDLTELYSDSRDTSYELYKGKSAFEDLNNIISEKKHEFIVVQRGSRLFLDQMFRKFLINKLVYEGDIPLIILP